MLQKFKKIEIDLYVHVKRSTSYLQGLRFLIKTNSLKKKFKPQNSLATVKLLARRK